MIEMSSDGSGHDGGNFDFEFPHVEHGGLCKADQAKFTCVVGCAAFKEICAGEGCDGDKISIALFQGFKGGLQCVKNSCKVCVDDFVPLFVRHGFN